mmetsp:Transcript_46936/g.118916  ORF Transcript_46936/g.118916 Transcript_46936/m.118916 type:complete len:216 (+) Transcript_46936:179-826(+)
MAIVQGVKGCGWASAFAGASPCKDTIAKSAVASTIMKAPRACDTTNGCLPEARATAYKTTSEQHFEIFVVTDDSCLTMSADNQESPISVANTITVEKSQPRKKCRTWKPGTNASVTVIASNSPILKFVMRVRNGKALASLNALSEKRVANTLNSTQEVTHTKPTMDTLPTVTELILRAVKEVHATQMRKMSCHCTAVYLRPRSTAEKTAVSGNFI